VTLHSGLTTFLSTLSRASLTAYSEYHQNTLKNREANLTPHHIPTSVKKLKLVLQPLDELKGSEGFKALQDELDADLAIFHRKLTDKFVTPLNKMNENAYLKRFHISIYQYLRKATQGFIAQLDICNYSEDQAVVDFLTTASPTDLALPPRPLDLKQHLQLYKEANSEVSILPLPTKRDTNIDNIINGINNTTREQQTVNQLPPPVEGINTTVGSPASSLSGTNSGNQNALAQQVNTEDFAIRTPRNGVVPIADTDHLSTHTITNTNTNINNIITPHSGSAMSLPPNLGQLTRPIDPPPRSMLTQQDLTPHAGIRGTEFQTAATALAQNLENLSPLRDTNETENQANNGNCTEILTQHDHDEALLELDLASITNDANQAKLIPMIQQLLLNTIKLPITEYHSSLVRRDELIRIRRITTSSLKSSLTSKVASKIQAERPADRPVLAGLIREESEKNTLDLRRQLKSATDQLEHVRQQQSSILNQLNLKRAPDTHRQHSNNSKKRGGSNKKHKNNTWSRSVDNDDSTVAAETLPTTQNSTVPPPQSQQNNRQQQQWGRPRPHPSQLSAGDSHTAADNATAAARRSKNKKRTQHASNYRRNNANLNTNSQT
jgi:hypothetical protein